ncbi:MAG: hypothetical protein IJ064_04705 [Bacteroidaceae bacterium]|nr:hypothetical protein [Bacteroidaceae bacterium]
MKKALTFIIATLLWAMPTMAQENKRPRFNLEEFKSQLEAYITQKAELTQTEAEKAFPLFMEMKAKQFELMKKIQKLRHREKEQLESESDYQDALTKIGELNIENAKIEANYYKKISKAISAKKAYRIKKADDAFHREALQRFNNGPKDYEKDKHPKRKL